MQEKRQVHGARYPKKGSPDWPSQQVALSWLMVVLTIWPWMIMYCELPRKGLREGLMEQAIVLKQHQGAIQLPCEAAALAIAIA